MGEEESQPVSLQDLMALAQHPEEIEGYDCDGCRRAAEQAGAPHVRSTMSQRANLLSETGEVLVFALYRFLNVIDGQGNFSALKVRRRVEIPTVLSVETGEYRLYGIVSHVGESLTNGHYIAAVRSLRDHQWYDCDDSRVKALCLRNLYEVSQVTATRSDADPFLSSTIGFGLTWRSPIDGFLRKRLLIRGRIFQLRLFARGVLQCIVLASRSGNSIIDVKPKSWVQRRSAVCILCRPTVRTAHFQLLHRT